MTMKLPDLARKSIFSDRLKHHIDLNTDFGQTRDKAYFESTEYQLLNYVSSVNIPCCVHDGDPKEVSEAIAIAKRFQCSIGAHIGYPDPANNGYEVMDISPEALTAWLYVQIGAFTQLVKANQTNLDHVRPHGALYQAFVNDEKTALLVAEVLYKSNPWTILMAPAGPILDEVAKKTGIRTAPEMYLGKKYLPTGVLDPQELNQSGNSLPPQGTFEQARQLIQQSSLTTPQGKPVDVKFKSLHISPSMPNAHQLAEKVCNLLGQPMSVALAEAGASGWL